MYFFRIFYLSNRVFIYFIRIGFIEFPDIAGAEKVLASGVTLRDTELRMDFAPPPKTPSNRNNNRSFNNEEEAPSDTLMIRNLPYSTEEKHLYELFTSANEIRIPYDRDNDRIKG